MSDTNQSRPTNAEIRQALAWELSDMVLGRGANRPRKPRREQLAEPEPEQLPEPGLQEGSISPSPPDRGKGNPHSTRGT